MAHSATEYLIALCQLILELKKTPSHEYKKSLFSSQVEANQQLQLHCL